MSTAGPPGPPHPPPADFDTYEVEVRSFPVSTPLYRIHRNNLGPIFFGPGAKQPPVYRWDAPGGEYGVCYAAFAPEIAFAETLLRQQGMRFLAMTEIEARSLAELHCDREFKLIAMCDAGLLRAGANSTVADGPYPNCHAWSLALYNHPVGADGIVYRACHDNSGLAIAFFDRVESHLQSDRSTCLSGLEADVGRWLDLYAIAVS